LSSEDFFVVGSQGHGHLVFFGNEVILGWIGVLVNPLVPLTEPSHSPPVPE
jgi:hypothetical protein